MKRLVDLPPDNYMVRFLRVRPVVLDGQICQQIIVEVVGGVCNGDELVLHTISEPTLLIYKREED